MAICSWRKKDLILLPLRRPADVGEARATSGVTRIGFHTKATQQRMATFEKKHLVTVHEKVVDLVEVVLLLGEHDEVLPAATRSFQSIFVYLFGYKQPGIRVFESPLESQ